MNDDLQVQKTILESWQDFDVAGTKKYVLTTPAGKFDLWMTKRDGTQSKAYIDFCSLGELNCQVEIGYKVLEKNGYQNNTVMFMNKLGGNVVEEVDNNNLEQRVATLESQVKELLESRPVHTSVQDLASEFGGTVVSQTPVPEQGSTNVSTPVNPDDESKGTVGSGPNGEVLVSDIPF